MTTVGDDNASVSGLLRRGGVSFMGGILAGITGLVLAVVVGRGYGPEGSGVFFTVIAVVMVLSNTAELGADTGLVWMLPRLRATGRADQQLHAIRIGLGPVLIASSVAAIGLWLFSGLVLAPSNADPDLVSGLRIASIAVLGGTVSTVAIAITRGFGRLAPFIVLQNIALPALRVVGVLAVVAVGWTVLAAVAVWAWAWVVVGLVALGIVIFLVRREVPDRNSPRQDGLVAEFWRFSGPRALAGVVEIALVWLDVILVAIFLGTAEAGIYAVASRFVTTGTLGENALRIALAPRFSSLFARQDRAGARALLGSATPLMVAFTWPIFLVSFVYAPTLLRIFGDQFDQGTAALRVLSVTMLVVSLLGPIQPVLLMSGHSSLQLLNKSTALVTQVAVNVILIPLYGIVGAAIAWSTALVVDNGMTTVELWRVEGIPAALKRAAGSALLLMLGAAPILIGIAISPLTELPAMLLSAAGIGAWVLVLLALPRSPMSLSRGLAA